MRVFITGGTGSIGRPVVRTLIERGHEVLALGRSAESRATLEALGASSVAGDIREPGEWLQVLHRVDAAIHLAAVWSDEMNAIDTKLVESILDTLALAAEPKRFIYTGGCWLYGATGDTVATEDSPLDSLPEFAWSIPLLERTLLSDRVHGMVIHPAMVYERDGGVLQHVVDDIAKLGYPRVIGDEAVRWPLVHRDDLAELYALVLENGKAGDVYNGSAVEGIPIGALTRAIAGRLGCELEPVVIDVDTARADFGSSAPGYALDQQLSGARAMRELNWQPRHTDVLADLA